MELPFILRCDFCHESECRVPPGEEAARVYAYHWEGWSTVYYGVADDDVTVNDICPECIKKGH